MLYKMKLLDKFEKNIFLTVNDALSDIPDNKKIRF